jgi:hypothetical protein
MKWLFHKIKIIMFCVFIGMPAIPLFIYVIWTNQLGRLITELKRIKDKNDRGVL